MRKQCRARQLTKKVGRTLRPWPTNSSEVVGMGGKEAKSFPKPATRAAVASKEVPGRAEFSAETFAARFEEAHHWASSDQCRRRHRQR